MTRHHVQAAISTCFKGELTFFEVSLFVDLQTECDQEINISFLFLDPGQRGSEQIHAETLNNDELVVYKGKTQEDEGLVSMFSLGTCGFSSKSKHVRVFVCLCQCYVQKTVMFTLLCSM